MYEMAYQLPNSRKQKTKYLKMDDDKQFYSILLKQLTRLGVPMRKTGRRAGQKFCHARKVMYH